MMMPRASAASRAGVMGGPVLFGPSPDTSSTRRKPKNAFESIEAVP